LSNVHSTAINRRAWKNRSRIKKKIIIIFILKKIISSKNTFHFTWFQCSTRVRGRVHEIHLFENFIQFNIHFTRCSVLSNLWRAYDAGKLITMTSILRGKLIKNVSFKTWVSSSTPGISAIRTKIVESNNIHGIQESQKLFMFILCFSKSILWSYSNFYIIILAISSLKKFT